MSKKRPTESSWDSDEELLNDTSGITAFPKNSELDLLAADGELEDEDALLSIDEANAKGHHSGPRSGYNDNGNTGQQDVGVDEQAFVFEEVDTGDLEEELNVAGEDGSYQDQQYAEDAPYEEAYGDGGDAGTTHVYQGEETGENIVYTEEGVVYEETDPGFQDYSEEGKVDPNFVAQDGEDEASVELAYEQPEEQDGQVHLEYGDAEAQITDTVESNEPERQFESESDSEDESSRHNRGKFTSERTGTISLAAAKERSSIPDTLELDKEQAEEINKFMADKNQGGKKPMRGKGNVRNRLGSRPGMRGVQPRPGGPMPPGGPNANPNFPMGGPPGPLSPRMLMGLIRGGAQMLRGLIPSQLLNARGPMAAQNLVRALGQRGPFPDGMPGPRGPPMRPGDPRGPFPRHPQDLMNHMRGNMRPGFHPGPRGMRERGPPPPRMPHGPFPDGPINPRMPMPGMPPPGPMRMMGPRGPGGPMPPDGPRKMLGQHMMGRGGPGPGPNPRFLGDGMLSPPPLRGLMNTPRGPPMPGQPHIRPLFPNDVQMRPGIRQQGPQIPASQAGPRPLSVHDRLGPRGAGKSVPPLMAINASKPGGSKSTASNEGQPIPSLVKPITATMSQGQGMRPIRPQGPRMGPPDQMNQQQPKGPRGLMIPGAMPGQRHKIFINPRFQGPQNQGPKQPTGITRTVRVGVPFQQRKAKALVDRAVQNRLQTNAGPRGPVNLKRRSTGTDDIPTKFIRTVGQVQQGQSGPQRMNVDRDQGKFKSLMEEQKCKRDLIIKRKELARQKQTEEKRKILIGDEQNGPGQNRGRNFMLTQNAPIQQLGTSLASRLGPPINKQVQPPPAASNPPQRNIVSGSSIRSPFQQAPPRFSGQNNMRGPRPTRPQFPNPVFKPPTLPPSRPGGPLPMSANRFSVPPPSSVSQFQTPPPRMATRPNVPPPVNIQSAPPRYQTPPPQVSPYQAPPTSAPPAYPPPLAQVAPAYSQPPPASAPPAAHYPPHAYAPPPSQPPPSQPPPASPLYPPAPAAYQPTQAVHQPPPTHYQPAVAPTHHNPTYPPPAAQPAHTEYHASYPPPTAQYTTPQRQEQSQYYDYATGSYYPATTTHTATSSHQAYQYSAAQTPTQSSYYDYASSQRSTSQTRGHDQRSPQHQSSVGQPIQTIGRRIQPATGSQMRSIVHNVSSPSSGISHSSQSGRVVVDTNVSVLPGPQKVSVYNVAKQATKETLLKVCRHFGKVLSIQFMREQDRAIIQFETGEQAAKCVSKCDQKCLLKTRLTVKLLAN